MFCLMTWKYLFKHQQKKVVLKLNQKLESLDEIVLETGKKEKQFLISQAADSGKPADIIEKMGIRILPDHNKELINVV